MKKCMFKRMLTVLLALVFALGLCAGCGSSLLSKMADDLVNNYNSETGDNNSDDDNPETYAEGALSVPAALKRASLLEGFVEDSEVALSPSLGSEETLNSLKDAVNYDAYSYLGDPYFSDISDLLLENKFVVTDMYYREFYEIYETNRYEFYANFVTVDSLMHSYHLYFSYLMRNLEKNELSSLLSSLSEELLEESEEQLEKLKGSEWERAAERNVVYFSVASALLGDDDEIPEEFKTEVNEELDKIMAAEGIDQCSITGDATFLDYSQFAPRGYYEGDEQLEAYFRAMMWYGQIGFLENDEDLNRSALLMNVALEDETLEQWEEIYSVTSFFAGSSDDLTYYEYMPIINEVYGENFELETLIGNDTAWKTFTELTDALEGPSINSVPVPDDNNPDTHAVDAEKGFRLIGQRATIDESVFQQLIYDYVQENSSGDRRMLPDTLDVAAALGSDKALDILEEQGDTDYKNYSENMSDLKETIAESDDSVWSASLYSAWLYTLTPLLETKGEGYPGFMQSDAWAAKSLETFAGSYTELKHDTVLYAKQVMSEMGGGDIPVYDDRGYVEPEVEVWARIALLSKKSAEGLKAYGLLSDEEEDNLELLVQLATQLETISEKELAGKLLTDDEYELIRTYGGNLEHLFQASYADEGYENVSTHEFPAAVVSDIATNPSDQTCLEVGCGNPDKIIVLVYFDGGYHICSGSVYDFYQFEQPISDRLTDTEWRKMVGAAVVDDSTYSYQTADESLKPEWTKSYRVGY